MKLSKRRRTLLLKASQHRGVVPTGGEYPSYVGMAKLGLVDMANRRCITNEKGMEALCAR